MQDAGISYGAELIIDRSVQPRDGHVVIAVIDGEMTVKRLSTGPTGVVLKADPLLPGPAGCGILGISDLGCGHHKPPTQLDTAAPNLRDEYIAHVDVNSFYLSCEWVFNSKLEAQAVIVLSNNYGCAVTHSGEAKTLGIEMGAPWFKLPVNANRHW